MLHRPIHCAEYPRPPAPRRARAAEARYRPSAGTDVLQAAWRHIALVSSFGAESVVLLHMAAQIDQDVPVSVRRHRTAV